MDDIGSAVVSPIDAYLAEQQELRSPAARLAQAAATASAGGRLRELIPLTQPGPGERYAFEVDLDSCTGCKACVAACHALNGLDDDEVWRGIGAVQGSDQEGAFNYTVTSACHHCAEPGCLEGCPVLAYEVDPVTGIVRHLDDQCIGCSYCIFKCPYDVPKYNAQRGIVRKCDLCTGRLEAGEAPACAAACPTTAIRVVLVPTAAPEPAAFLGGAYDASYTAPTTRYLSHRGEASRFAAPPDNALAPEDPHWPLVLLTTLNEMAAGCTILAACGGHRVAAGALWKLACGAGWIGLAASVAHLGQPTRAWRIFLGLRRSWMSREAVAVGIWAVLAPAVWLAGGDTAVQGPPGWVAAAVAGLGLIASLMIYADTPRPLWALPYSAPRFIGGAAVLALAAAIATSAHAAAAPAAALVILVLTKVLWEGIALRPPGEPRRGEKVRAGERALLRRSSRLLAGPLLPVWILRCASAILGCVLLAGAFAGYSLPIAARVAGVGAVLGGELAERYLFFRAAAAPRMPGMKP